MACAMKIAKPLGLAETDKSSEMNIGENIRELAAKDRAAQGRLEPRIIIIVVAVAAGPSRVGSNPIIRYLW
jgi:hypothetical protein